MNLDLLGALFSLLCTYYFIQLNNKGWLVGMIATCLNSWLYWQKGIYADMVLEGFYFLAMIYGWLHWQGYTLFGLAKSSNTIKHLSLNQWGIVLIAIGVIYSFLYFVLSEYTQSTVASLDALTTALSIVAQILMCYKIIATWLLWFIADSLYALMYLSKKIPFHGILMLIYTGMAISGYWVWTRNSPRSPELSPS